LQRLTNAFECLPADIDEQPREGETPARLAARLAAEKAEKLAAQHPGAIVVGSDQVAALGDSALGKPGTPERAAEQLAACAGREVVFYTAVAVIRTDPGFREQHTDITRVQFRNLTAPEINAYLTADQPWDCAGSFRSEGLGAVLFESIHNRDPAAIIGLPLIWLAGSLRRAGLQLL
jgi:septum formation protein